MCYNRRTTTETERNMNMGQTILSVRMDADLKQRFDAFCAEVGMNSSVAVNLFVRSAIGIIVDEVKEVITLSEGEIDKPDASESNDVNKQYLGGVGKTKEGLVTLLNINSVINEKDTV